MSFLDILYEREKEYSQSLLSDKDRRKKIVACILNVNRLFKKSGYPTLKEWSDREIDFLHLAIMYADVYLTSRHYAEETQKHNDLVIAAGCYSVAYKYETDSYETEFLEFVRDSHKNCVWNFPALLIEVLNFEWILLKVLNWRVNLITPVAFINEYANEINIDPDDAYKLSLKLLISDVCLVPSNWGISCLLLTNVKAVNYFDPSDEDMALLVDVQLFINDSWQLFKQENPELKRVVKQCNTKNYKFTNT